MQTEHTSVTSGQQSSKKALQIDLALKRIEEAVRPYRKAALFELADEGFDSTFEQLVACMISIRTRDEVTIPVSLRLFSKARTPAQMSQLTPELIEQCISGSSYARTKAQNIHKIAKQVVERFNGELPCEEEVLLALPGIGPKCSNLILGLACKQPKIGVDIHVHRVCNRWGYVQEKTPEKSLLSLEMKVPQYLWIELNRVLMPFGKHICTGNLPHCTRCPVEDMCRQVGVNRYR